MPAGRPPIYKKPEEMQVVIDDYFSALGDDKPTVAGLAYALGMSRVALNDYEVKPEFLYTIKRAKQKIEISLEQHLFSGAVAGAIFNLKNNFGWKDKTEQDINAKIENKDVSAVDAIKQLIESKSK